MERKQLAFPTPHWKNRDVFNTDVWVLALGNLTQLDEELSFAIILPCILHSRTFFVFNSKLYNNSE